MKNIILSTMILGLLAGCDAPVRSRVPLKTETLRDSTPAANTLVNPGTLGGPTTTTPVAPGTTPATGTTTDASFPSCDLAAKYHTTEVGYFGLCQSTVNETMFKVKFGMVSGTRNCIIPTYKDASGNSTYIGQPQCTAVNTADATINGSLYKNRAGFESYPLNGVIVMKEPLLPQYFSCMHAYINWLPQACPSGPNSSQYCYQWMQLCPYGAKTNQTCDQGAKAYMAEVCNRFKSTYSNTYIDIRTK